jgi:hypothetical protein
LMICYGFCANLHALYNTTTRWALLVCASKLLTKTNESRSRFCATRKEHCLKKSNCVVV